MIKLEKKMSQKKEKIKKKKILVRHWHGIRIVLGEVRSVIDVVVLFLEDSGGYLGELTVEELDAANTPEEAVNVISRHYAAYTLEEEDE